jgi:transposase
MLKVDQAYVIRHKVLVEGKSRRQVAREMRVSRNTVRKYVEADDPEPRRIEGPRARPVRERAEAAIDELLEEWKDRIGGKQRVTGTRVHRALSEAGIEVGATLVREILAERRRKATEASIPLVHRPGEEAQVDFFEVLVDEDGVRRKAWKFVMRLMYSGRDFVW